MTPTTIYFDLETGGLELQRPVIQFAAIAVDSDWHELETLELKIKFKEADCTPEALKKNHYDPKLWAKCAVPMESAVRQIAEFLNRHACVTQMSKRTNKPFLVAKLCGHSAMTFDGPRLLKMFKDEGDRFFPGHPHMRDLLQRALFWFDERGIELQDDSCKLESLCKYAD